MKESIESISSHLSEVKVGEIDDELIEEKLKQLIELCSTYSKESICELLMFEREFRQVFQKEMKLGLFLPQGHELAGENFGPIFFLLRFLLQKYAGNGDRKDLVLLLERALELFMLDESLLKRVEAERGAIEERVEELKKKLEELRKKLG